MTARRLIRDGATVLALEIVELRHRLHQQLKIGLHLPRDTSGCAFGVGIALEHRPRSQITPCATSDVPGRVRHRAQTPPAEGTHGKLNAIFGGSMFAHSE